MSAPVYFPPGVCTGRSDFLLMSSDVMENDRVEEESGMHLLSWQQTCYFETLRIKAVAENQPRGGSSENHEKV